MMKALTESKMLVRDIETARSGHPDEIFVKYPAAFRAKLAKLRSAPHGDLVIVSGAFAMFLA